MSDRFSNPFTAPRIHLKLAGGTPVEHPFYGRTTSSTWLACGNTRSLRTTTDKAKVTCQLCLAAIKRDGL